MMGCALARPLVVAHAFERTTLPRPVAGHLSRCLHCRALQARTRRTARSLRRLRDLPVPGEASGAVAVHGRASRGHPDRLPARPRWLLAGAGAAAAVAAVAWLRRSEPAR
jgi:hypothetical protein